MRRVQLAGAVASTLLTAALAFAQPQPQTQPPRPQTQPQDPTPVPDPKPPTGKPRPAPGTVGGELGSGNSEILVTGCLQRAEDPSSGNKESARLGGGFILKQATTAKSNDPGAAPNAASGSKEYRVVASRDSIKLAEHVGHQVEAKGRVTLQDEAANQASTDASVSSSRPSGSTGVSTVPPATGATPAAASLVTLSVTSIKMISASCSAPAS
jgi:hypothetical protein